MAVSILLPFGAYLFGAIPTANILALTLRRVDLRNYGSGAVTSSNVSELLGKWAGAVTGVADILKGAAPVWAAQALGLGLPEQMAAGLATIVGHNWSIYLRLQGGRGLTTFIGVLMAVAPVEFLLMAFTGFFGVALFRNVPVILGLSAALVPVWSVALDEEASIIWGTVIMVLLVLLKRLTGNRLEPMPAQGRAKVLRYRLLYDRDTRERQDWIRREESDRPAGNP